MKLALSFVCLLLIIAGVFDLTPYRPRRNGHVEPLRRRSSASRQSRAARR